MERTQFWQEGVPRDPIYPFRAHLLYLGHWAAPHRPTRPGFFVPFVGTTVPLPHQQTYSSPLMMSFPSRGIMFLAIFVSAVSPIFVMVSVSAMFTILTVTTMFAMMTATTMFAILI